MEERVAESAAAGSEEQAVHQAGTGEQLALQLLMDTVIDTERIRAEQQAIPSPRVAVKQVACLLHLTLLCVQAAVQRLIQIQVWHNAVARTPL